MQVPDQIRCMECQGLCHRLTQRPIDDPFEPGDVVAYRCPDCLERWDMELADEDPGRFDPSTW